MKLVKFLQYALLNALPSVAYPADQADSSLEAFQSSCASIGSTLDLENVTVYFSEFVASGTNLSLPDNNATCTTPFMDVPVDLCRIALYVSTSERSGIHMEAWLPANWTGRFLSAGNGGIAGCIGYDDMSYAVGYGFASVGANNGHNGTSGGAMLNNPDVVADFAYRS
jgi:feruloyl esterase